MTDPHHSDLPTPGGHYSPAVRAGDVLYVAGQTPRDDSRRVVGTTVAEQTEKVLDNLSRVLAAGGATLDQVVKTTVFLTSLDDIPAFNAAYARRFPNTRPVRTVIVCTLNAILVELDAVAYLGGDRQDIR